MNIKIFKKKSPFPSQQTVSKERGIGVPLKNPIFRTLWIANFISNLGNIMQGVAAAWLMTSLTRSPFLIGLVLTAFNLPIFLFGLPCGVCADLFSRRRLLVVAQLLMMTVSMTMVILTLLGLMTAGKLLFFIFLLGIGTALHLPSWMALLQDLVAQEHLAAAVSLNSIGFNLARTLGPALGGFCIHFIGVPLAFLCDAFSYLVVLFGLVRIPAAQLPTSPAEKPTFKKFFQALLGIKTFVLKSSLVPGILLRLVLFTMGNAGVLGLLPFIVCEELHLGVNNYGAFLSCFGIGSVLGALCLPRLRRYFSVNVIVSVGIFLSASSIFCLAYSKTFLAVALCMGFFGVAWIIVLVNYNISLQLSAPACLKGRMISLYVVFFQGGIGLGSGLGGWIASGWGTRRSLILEALVVVSSLLLVPVFAIYKKSMEVQKN